MIGTSGTDANLLYVIPFLISVLPVQLDRDALALEDHLDIRERRAAVRHEDTRGPSMRRSGTGVIALAIPITDAAGHPRGWC